MVFHLWERKNNYKKDSLASGLWQTNFWSCLRQKIQGVMAEEKMVKLGDIDVKFSYPEFLNFCVAPHQFLKNSFTWNILVDPSI